MKSFLSIYLPSLIICHRYEEIEPSCWCLNNRAGKWVWPCASYSDTVQCLQCSRGCWGFGWQTRAFLVVIVVYGILVFPSWCFVFFSLNEKPLNLSWFSVEASVWQAFELPQPSRMFSLFVWIVTMGNNIAKWKTAFPDMEYVIRFIW